jgi:hydrogenase maturation protein HypF
VARDTPRQLRRSRGYIPTPIFLKRPQPEILALGAELKNTICLTKNDRAFLSQHIGDLKNLEALNFFKKTVGHLKRILQISPQALAADLHPLYLSTQFARSQQDLPVIFVQHHHAHIASCLAENAAEGPVIGLSFDGTGYGQDGTIWGGEFLIAGLEDFRRVGHLESVPMPGGDKAIEEPWRMALAYMYAACGDTFDVSSIDSLKRVNPERRAVVLKMIKSGVNCPPTSSLGRLFDAVSALLGICERATYEGQPAMELEGAISERLADCYDYDIRSEDGQFIVKARKIIKGVVSDLTGGEEPSAIACKFHNTVVKFSLDVCLKLRGAQGINEVALSGGCFQNEYLSEELVRSLDQNGFVVYEHSQVPPNDGGISLGQAVIAGSSLRKTAPAAALMGQRIE